MSGSGADIWNTADAFHFSATPTTGNVVLIVQVNSLTATNPWAKAGLMLRQNMSPDSPHVLLCVTPQNGLAFQRRLSTGAISQHTAVRSAALLAQTPAPWLKLERTGNLIKAWWSPNGTQWQIAGSLTVPWTDPLYAGLAVTAHQRGSLATAQFSDLSLSAAGIAPLPSPWLHQELGNVSMSGFADYAGNTFTVCGSGNDIWNATDAFHYAYQPLNGDGELIAQVTGPTATNPWAKAGLMIRETLTAESRHAMLVTTPANGLAWQRRLGTGAQSQHRAILSAEQLAALPQSWLKITRRGDLLTSFYSADGQTWTLAGTENLANLPTQIYLGLAVTAHRNGALSQADFSQVSFTPYPAMTLPPPWEQADVGAPGAQGMANSSNGSQFTLYGSGADIWGTADACHYVYQTLPAEGSIVARVTAQQNTNPWAKAGIMIRESLAPGSRHALLLLSPGNGIALQRRLTPDSSSLHTQVLKPATAPVWLKLQRSGTTVQAYRSIDGQTWISAGSVNLNTTGPLLMGLAVTSHQAGVINRSQFEQVSTTGGVPVIVDTDNDGLPDEWELAQFGNLNQDQTTDADSDGILDIDEYRTGTNPKDPPTGALPAAATNLQAIIQEDGSVELTWTDNANNEDNYLIKRSDDGGQTWRLLATLPANTTTYTDRSGLLAQSKPAPSFWDFLKIFSLSAAWAQQSPSTYSVSPNNEDGAAPPTSTTAQPKSGGEGNNLLKSIPQLTLAPINISENASDENDVSGCNMDDSNNVVFYYSQKLGETKYKFIVKSWNKGEVKDLRSLDYFTVATQASEEVTPGYSTPTGIIIGETGTSLGTNYSLNSDFIFGDNGVEQMYIPGGNTTGLRMYRYLDNGNYIGGADVEFITANPVRASGGIIRYNGAIRMFSDSVEPAGTTAYNGINFTPVGFYPQDFNNNGQIIGGNMIWDGQKFEYLTSGNTTSINDLNQVTVGIKDEEGLLWTKVSPTTTVHSLLPAEYKSQVKKIYPIKITNPDPATGVVRIVFGAYHKDPTQSGGEVWKNFLLEYSATPAINKLYILKYDFQDYQDFNSNTSNVNINANGIHFGVAKQISSGKNQALLLLPIELVSMKGSGGSVNYFPKSRTLSLGVAPFISGINIESKVKASLPAGIEMKLEYAQGIRRKYTVFKKNGSQASGDSGLKWDNGEVYPADDQDTFSGSGEFTVNASDIPRIIFPAEWVDPNVVDKIECQDQFEMWLACKIPKTAERFTLGIMRWGWAGTVKINSDGSTTLTKTDPGNVVGVPSSEKPNYSGTFFNSK